jgi:predicted HTH domain antitoxin
MRLPKSEVGQLADAARESGMERSTFLRRALRRGAEDLMFEMACDAYRRGEATLSRAAEIAGIDLRDMIVRLRAAALDLNYRLDDLEQDLRP